MKLFKYFSLLAIALFFSCSSDDDNIDNSINETEDLTLVKNIENNQHTLSVFTENGLFQLGYNKIYFQIKDGENYVNNAQVSWKPMMHMTDMSHSCPYSLIGRKPNTETLYEGYIVFQMPDNDMEHWELTFDYTINGEEFTITEPINIISSDKKRVNVFTGSDDVRYIIALIEPTDPEVAVNDMSAGIFKMENMMNFPVVDNYTLKIDPRMPSMGNHSSPNNVHLTQGAQDLYHGKLSLTMTGYWKINLQLLNAQNEVLKGEEITDTNEASSIFFEIEF
ncbi:MAG: hypothetical protein WDZ45_07890 [Flavobacteriaceae bacterium]